MLVLMIDTGDMCVGIQKFHGGKTALISPEARGLLPWAALTTVILCWEW